MVVLDRIPLISIQFRFSPMEVAALPPFIKSKGCEMMAKHLHFGHASGELVYQRTKNCSVAALPEDLNRTGYRMISTTYTERTDQKNGRVSDHLVTLVFAHPEIADRDFAVASTELKRWEDLVAAEFKASCSTAMYELQAFSNPIMRDSKEVANQRELRFNLSGRVPLFRSDGKPVLVYPRDGEGRVCGFGKPLTPELNFAFEGDKLIALERVIP